MDRDPDPLTPGPRLRGPFGLALLVFLLGLLLTAGGSILLYDAARQRERQALDDEASAQVRQLELAIELALESLNAVRALFMSGLPLDDARFEAFARADAAPHRGTLALGWAPRVAAADRARFERELAAELDRPGAEIFEATGHGLRRAAPPRDEHYPLRHLATVDGPETEPGLDLLSLSGRRSAIEAAVRRGEAAATKVRRADAWGQPGELVVQAFLPVPGPRPGDPPRGVVLGVFSVSEIVGRGVPAGAPALRVDLYDRSAPGPEQHVLSLGPGAPAEGPAADPGAVSRSFAFADRRWEARLARANGRPSYATLLWPMAGLLGGLALTTLLAAYLFVAQARGRQVFWLSRRLMQEQVALEVQRRLREQALAAAQARSSFLQAASHDLRQPLHALALYLNLLGDEPERGRDPTFMAQLQHSAAALQGLFDALLDIGRLEGGQVEPAPRAVDLLPLLRGLLDESRALAQRKGLRLIGQLAPATVVTDPLLLERVLRNLLVNALRHTPRGWVALRAVRRGDRLRLTVIDSGPGLAKAQRARLLGQDAPAAGPGPMGGPDGGRGGAGLGLSIVQELARRLGHPLALRSRLGRGSAVSLSLPLAGAAGPAHAEPALPAAAPAWTAGWVLLLDDDAEVRAATAARLRAWGAPVVEAASLAEARARLAQAQAEGRPPGLALLDWRLPDGLGGELLAALHDPAGRPLPRVWVSAEAGGGADGPPAGEVRLRKPVTALKLRSAIDAAQRRAAENQAGGSAARTAGSA